MNVGADSISMLTLGGKMNKLKNLITGMVLLSAMLVVLMLPYSVHAENENEGVPAEPSVEITEPVEPEPTTEPDVPTDTPLPTEEPVPTEEPEPTPEQTPSTGPTDVPVDIPVATEVPEPTADPNITITPTPTPYLTVVPPSEDREYPAPDRASDKSIRIKSPSVVKIDGIYDIIWDSIPSCEIKNVAWGENGASGSFKTYWDKEYLYVLVEVNDMTPDTASDRFTRQDCVEIFLNEDGTRPEKYGLGDHHIKINRDGIIEYGNNTDDKMTYAKVIEKEGGYYVEVSFTFNTIHPSYGQAIGFDVRINDSQGNQYRDYMIQWSDTSMYTYDRLNKIGLLFLK